MKSSRSMEFKKTQNKSLAHLNILLTYMVFNFKFKNSFIVPKLIYDIHFWYVFIWTFGYLFLFWLLFHFHSWRYKAFSFIEYRQSLKNQSIDQYKKVHTSIQYQYSIWKILKQYQYLKNTEVSVSVFLGEKNHVKTEHQIRSTVWSKVISFIITKKSS